jgi:hypothetical protein
MDHEVEKQHSISICSDPADQIVIALRTQIFIFDRLINNVFPCKKEFIEI